jgi:DNA replication protein DnaC
MNWLLESKLKNPNPTYLVLPERYQDAHLGGIKHKLLWETSRDYLVKFWDVAPLGIAPLFVGTSGEYKTYAALVIAKQVSSQIETSVVWCPQFGLQLTLSRFSMEPIIRRYCEVPFLVMDDFAALAPDKEQMQALLAITSERYNNKRPTLWTANVVVDEKDPFKHIRDRYGVLVERRLMEMSNGFRVSV